jgi:solute:Na+ symporter, SSS family
LGGVMIQTTVLDIVVIVVYFLGILAFGAYFMRYTKTTRDFFFGGQRFSWWLIGMSSVATTIGSYSFIKYAAAGYRYGFSSSMTYLNDWIILPFFVFGWLPIIYFKRIISIPEYFEKRFDRKSRFAALTIMLVYMIGYVGINFYTLGVALQPLLGINLYYIVIFVAVISAIYMHAGGQTSVIMTDLLQGFLLIICGFTLFYLGINHLGGFEKFLDGLPLTHKLPLADFNHPPKFNFAGIFWQDGVVNTVGFYFINQGVLMRFMSAKSHRESYKALFFVMIVLMPVAAIAAANAGWLGKAMVFYGMIPEGTDPQYIFVAVTNLVTKPGLFGLIIAALSAALMSTIDTLITAISALFVNDIWRPFVVKDREDKYYLKVAKWSALGISAIGVCLVPIFAAEQSIYVAHGKFIATVIPSLVVVILLSVFWKRFTPAAAFWTLVIGFIATAVVSYFPQFVQPIAHGVSPEGNYKYMRALFGLIVSLFLAVGITIFTKPKEDIEGLVIDSFHKAKEHFKGGKPNEIPGKTAKVRGLLKDITGVSVSPAVLEIMKANVGDLIYVTDSRWYFGGLHSFHSKICGTHKHESDLIYFNNDMLENAKIKENQSLKIEKIL